ncbi:MAG: 30S ribosomal protein S27e [Candidatus Thermoplasmatota archaeon]|nr:30S ribosomal protein S27e [Candidatus Thermoplasmatota archaeon]MCJ2564469.1 30S ribosomal protein S27e [Candidatus Thermoplasmatota archaeon]
MVDLPGPKSKFLQVRCPDCPNEQIVFDHASTKVTCLVCGATIVRPKGGKAEIRGEVVKAVE